MDYPRINTMAGRVLAVLLSGEEITHRDVWFRVASYRLSSQICTLSKKYDWKISKKWEQALTKDPANRIARYKRYYLEKSIIVIAGGDGEMFVKNVQQWEQERKAKRAAATAQLTNTIGTIDKSHHTFGGRE